MWKPIVLLLSCLAFCACSGSRKTYGDFSFLPNDAITIDTTLIGEAQNRTAVMHPDSTWTWFCQLSTTFDIGYKLYCCDDSPMLFFYGRDTFSLNDLLGPDTAYLDWFTISNFYGAQVYRLINRYSGEQHLYLSWGVDGFGNRPGRRINVVFPISKDGRYVAPGFAYVTNTFEPESEPCLDCFTDANRDGQTDFVQWFCAENEPVLYFNSFYLYPNLSNNLERTYYDSGYESVTTYDGWSWAIVRKKRFGRWRKQ